METVPSREVRANIRLIPEGTYRSVAYIDSDGVVNEPLEIRLTIIATGGSVDPHGALTVDSLFAIIERGIAGHYAEMRVTYDPVMGFPTQIYSDASHQIADDEITYEVKDLVRLK